MSSPAKYHHRRTAARTLLLTGYFFFFAIQFSYRYYDVANFVVYKSNTARIQQTPHQQTAAHTYQANAKRPAHLAVDKRYSYKGMIQPFFAAHQAPIPSYIIITRKALPPPVVYSTPDLPTNSLRGPPTV